MRSCLHLKQGPSLYLLCLYGCDGNGVDNIIYAAASTEIINRFFKALQYRTDGNGSGTSLHCFIGVVTGVEVGKDKDGRFAGYCTLRQLRLGDIRIDRCVVLDRSFD